MPEFKSKVSLPQTFWRSGPGGLPPLTVIMMMRVISNYPRVISHNDGHSERCKVTGVAWCPVQGGAGRDRAELASGAEDGVVSDHWPIRGLVSVSQSEACV